jgi:ATPase subunit of ABC transporter with duplicated ATPase domains
MAEYIYTLKKARKAHGDKVILDDVTLSFLPGAKIGVVGPNGAGKSTLLKIMAGMDDNVEGTVWRDPSKTVGFLQQEPQLDPSLDALIESQRQTNRLLQRLIWAGIGFVGGLAVMQLFTHLH